jgi:hypothetical protein
MAFILTTNSSSVTKTMPAKYLSKISTDLMFRFDTTGLEVNDLEDPSELAELHYVAFKRVYVHNLDIVRRELFRVLDDTMKAYRPTFKDIESSPGTAWNNIFKRTILRISKEGVWGSWKELPTNKNGPYLASEFFVLWPFLVAVINEMPVKRRLAMQRAIKGSTAPVVRGLVKHFDLLKCGYPIHMSKTRPLLKISSVVDAEMLQVQSKMKQQRQQLIKSGKKKRCNL